MNAEAVTLLVIAKEPAPGRAKTRLCPPCSAEQAATVAAAALTDTLEAVARTPACRHVLVLAGDPGPWVPTTFAVVAQRGDGLDERLAAAFDAVDGPALLVGMDTPQITPALLASAASTLLAGGNDAVLGPAADGGWWAIGLPGPDADAFRGVPMSTAETGAHQHARLVARGYRVARLATLRDVDTWSDACAVAAETPASHFSAAVAEVATVVGRRTPARRELSDPAAHR